MSKIQTPNLDVLASTLMVKLPLEVIQNILQHLIAHAPVTPRGSGSDKPRLHPAFLAARTTLSNVSRTCRVLHLAAEAFLYQCVVLRNRRELVCFFRTMVMIPRRRDIVHTFIWTGVLSRPSPRGWPTDLELSLQNPRLLPRDRAYFELVQQRLVDAWGCLGEESVDEEMVMAVSECWQRYHLVWPGPSKEDQRIAAILDLYKDERALAERFYRAILAMLPRLRVFFTGLGMLRAPIPPRCQLVQKYPEEHAIRYLATSLRGLSIAIFECHSHPEATFPIDLFYHLLRHSHSLRQIHIKGFVNWIELLQRSQMIPNRRPTAALLDPKPNRESIEEISIFRSRGVSNSINAIAILFPKLRRLRAEYDSELPLNSIIPPEVVSLKGLTRLADTLEVLHLSTTVGTSWTYPRFASTITRYLKEMHRLKFLSTECAWLFGRQDLNLALDLFSLLPHSLQSFCLRDYWGVAEGSADYYPVFPGGTPPSRFMQKILQNLCDSYAKQPKSMRHLRVLSPQSSLSTAEDDTDRTVEDEACLVGLPECYKKLGIDFSVGILEDLETYEQGAWYDID